MPRLVHPREMNQGVDGRGKRSIEPTSSLADKFWCTFRNIGFTLRGLHVGQMPFRASFGNQFETQDPILGQEHVLLEDVHSLDTLLSQLLGKCVIAVEILFERSSHDCAEAVGREGTGQHTDITERTLQRFVEDVTDLVFKVLSRDKWIEEIFPAFTQHGVDFTAGTTKIFVVVKCFPKSK